LVASLSRLPGIGPRSAERIALFLVQAEQGAVRSLADAILEARGKISECAACGGLTERQPCDFCGDTRRDHSVICVVERAVDILSIEKAGAFRGVYHVLGGKISPLNGVEPEDLRLAELEKRCANGIVSEMIVGLPSDVEGDATAHYLNKLFTPRGVKVTRLAHGLPVGGGLEYADELTVSRALEGRRQFS
jgi:recombination protein RecR